MKEHWILLIVIIIVSVKHANLAQNETAYNYTTPATVNETYWRKLEKLLAASLEDIIIGEKCPTFCNKKGDYHNTSQVCIWPPHCCEDIENRELFCCDNESLALPPGTDNLHNCDEYAWAWWEQYWRTVLGCGLALGLLTFICSFILCLYQHIRDKKRRLMRARADSTASSTSTESSRANASSEGNRSSRRDRSNSQRRSGTNNMVSDDPVVEITDYDLMTVMGSGGVANPGDVVIRMEPIKPPPYTADKPPPYQP